MPGFEPSYLIGPHASATIFCHMPVDPLPAEQQVLDLARSFSCMSDLSFFAAAFAKSMSLLIQQHDYLCKA
jgi:hypothetical protein